MNRPKYSNASIGSIDSLAKALHMQVSELVRLAQKADSFFHLKERKEKPDGSFRDIYRVDNELKLIQEQIIKIIYYATDFPNYLQGSIKDKVFPRSHITDAGLHLYARVLIKMDISNFYPSLKAELIYQTWKRFFNFSEEVAQILTEITTFNGFLPQGAPTSPGLGNLVFWDLEYEIVQNLSDLGFKYSRYVDDVTVSTENLVEISELAPIFRMVFGMFKKRGVVPNRNKITISTSGHPMVIHNLNVNNRTVTIPKTERSRIRKAVKICEEMYKENPTTEEYEQLWLSTYGRVRYLNQLHPSQAITYITKMEDIRPVLSDSQLKEIERIVSECEISRITPQKYTEIKKHLGDIAQIHSVTLKPFLDRIKVIEPTKKPPTA